MSQKARRRCVPSLLSISSDYVVHNLANLQNRSDIRVLPTLIKDKMLRQFTTGSYLWRNVDFKEVLSYLVHPNTNLINLTSYNVDDEVLNIVATCTNIEKLFITQKGKHSLTSEALVNLFPHVRKLNMLRLSNCSVVNDEVIASISNNCTSLAGLDIHGCTNVTSASLHYLAPLQSIEWLTLSKTNICDEGLNALISGPSGKNLKELRLANCTNITESVLKLVADYCPELEVLVFHGRAEAHLSFEASSIFKTYFRSDAHEALQVLFKTFCHNNKANIFNPRTQLNLCKIKCDQHRCCLYRVLGLTSFSFGNGTLKNLKQIDWTIQW